MENEANMENKKYDESRIYYVYKHVRLDNNTCFYIGKGKGSRIYVPKRNNFHDNICKKYGYKAVIFKDKLTEYEAFKLERDMINCYVFKMGYGIYIKGYMNKKNNKFLTNMTWGGEGSSGLIPWNKGKKGIFHNSEEQNKNISKATKGKNNPMYGKHHSKEAKRKMSESKKGKKHHMHDKGKKIICITTGKIFDTQTEAENYYNVGNISKCCRRIRKSAGKLPNGTPLQWKYLKDYDNEFNGILINPITE